MNRAYLDYNATAPLRPRGARGRCSPRSISPAIPPRSTPRAAPRARIVEDARREVAELAGASPARRHLHRERHGGRQSRADARHRRARRRAAAAADRRRRRAFLRALGPSLPAEAARSRRCARDGRIDLDALEAALTARPPAHAGAAGRQQRDRACSSRSRKRRRWSMRAGGFVVCDAVQTRRADCRCDGRARSAPTSLMLSAHKFGGPKGAGALVAARAGLHVGAPLLRGGGQERGARAGTENVAAIAGFGAAARAAWANWTARRRGSRRLRDGLEARLLRVAPRRGRLRRRARRGCPTRSASPFPASPPRRC